MNNKLKRYICIVLTMLVLLTIPIQNSFAAKSTEVLKRGMRGDNITKLQRDLKKLGYLSAEPTGLYGSLTEAAVNKFQKKYSLTANGKADSKTLEKIAKFIKRTAIKIVIDPGHGGTDVGTLKGKVYESNINLSISKILKSNLTADLYNVSLTRDKDVALYNLSKIGDTQEERDLNARTNIINKSGSKLFVSIHVNSFPQSPSTSGSIVFYNDKLPQSKILASKIQQELNILVFGKWKRQTHNVQEANFYVLRNSKVPGVLVETGFITNSKELSLLTTDSYKNKIAGAIERGINSYID